jgi:hypothetical protein
MNQQSMMTEVAPTQAWGSLSCEEKTHLYQRWKHLGWSQGRFCKKYNLPLDGFSVWCQEIEAQQRSGFSKVTWTAPPQNELMTVELSFSNQVTARIQVSEHQFGFLLQEVLHATSIAR